MNFQVGEQWNRSVLCQSHMPSLNLCRDYGRWWVTSNQYIVHFCLFCKLNCESNSRSARKSKEERKSAGSNWPPLAPKPYQLWGAKKAFENCEIWNLDIELLPQPAMFWAVRFDLTQGGGAGQDVQGIQRWLSKGRHVQNVSEDTMHSNAMLKRQYNRAEMITQSVCWVLPSWPFDCPLLWPRLQVLRVLP